MVPILFDDYWSYLNYPLSPFENNGLKVHEVKKNLKLNLVNNESRDKSKCFLQDQKAVQYNDTSGFEFWSISQVLIKMYRQHTENRTYKLNNNHAN